MDKSGLCPICGADYDVELDEENEVKRISISCSHTGAIQDAAEENRND